MLTFSSNVSVAGNLSITGDLSYDDVSADSAVFSGSVAIGNNLTADSVYNSYNRNHYDKCRPTIY